MAEKDVGLPFLSSGAGEGRRSRGRDPSEGGNLLKFISFFFTLKNLGHRSPQVRCRPSPAISRWLLARFSGGRSPRQAPLLPGLSAALQDVENQCVAECLYFGKSYHILLGKVTNGNLPLEHNTTLPFHIYSFALASIFLRGRTYLPILPHLICRLNGASERLAERHPEGRKRSETHTNFLYSLSLSLSCVRSRVLHPMSVGGRWHRKGISADTMMQSSCPYTLLYI